MADALGNLFKGAHRHNPSQPRDDFTGSHSSQGSSATSVNTGGILSNFGLNVTVNYNKEFEPPSHWTRKDENFIPLSSECTEYNKVVNNFLRTKGGYEVEIIQVWRVENESYYEKYCIHRKHRASELSRTIAAVETTPLWHGAAEESVEAIAHSKFDRGYADRKVYGRGCYFATTSAYSMNDGYSVPNEEGEKHMFQVSVVTGDYCLGKGDMKAAPTKPGGGQYDSVVDNVKNPGMYVVFDDCAAYPEYLIRFKFT